MAALKEIEVSMQFEVCLSARNVKVNQWNKTDNHRRLTHQLHILDITDDHIHAAVNSLSEVEKTSISEKLTLLNIAQQSGLRMSIEGLKPHVSNLSYQDLATVFVDILRQISQLDSDLFMPN